MANRSLANTIITKPIIMESAGDNKPYSFRKLRNNRSTEIHKYNDYIHHIYMYNCVRAHVCGVRMPYISGWKLWSHEILHQEPHWQLLHPSHHQQTHTHTHTSPN